MANAPTPDQHGTGDRLGLFRDVTGTVWGIPLMIADNGDLLGCAPPKLREFSITDTLPVMLKLSEQRMSPMVGVKVLESWNYCFVTKRENFTGVESRRAR